MSYLSGAPADESNFPTLQNIKAEFGFIPNFFRAQTLRPDFIDAQAELFATVLGKEGALSRRQKEYIFLVCAARNLSTYCVTVHCEMIRLLGIEGPEPEQVAVDHTVSDIPSNDKALLDFAVKLNSRPREITREDVETLRGHGFSDTHILESVITVGIAKFSNFVAFGLGTVPDFDSSRIVQSLGLAAPENILNPASAASPLINYENAAPSRSLVDEDADLVRRTQAGELEAFDQLVLRHQRRIYRTLMAVTRHADDAEDGAQEVFIKAFRNLGGFQGASKFVTWLTRIAINEGTARLRARKDTDTLDDPTSGAEESPFRPKDIGAWEGNPEQMYSEKEIREKVEQELLKIPAKYRVPVMLRDLQDMSTDEAAEVLGLGVPALKSRLLRGRLMLREAIGKSLGRRAANV